jgi:hypothetical protein
MDFEWSYRGGKTLTLSISNPLVSVSQSTAANHDSGFFHFHVELWAQSVF